MVGNDAGGPHHSKSCQIDRKLFAILVNECRLCAGKERHNDAHKNPSKITNDNSRHPNGCSIWSRGGSKFFGMRLGFGENAFAT